MNVRDIIIVAALVVAGILVAGYFGVKNCNCDCKGDQVKKGDNDDLRKQVDDLRKKDAVREKQLVVLQGTIDAYADCLEKLCKKRKVTRKPPRRRRHRRRPPTPIIVSLPDRDPGDSHESGECRVVRVSGRTVYTRDCQGWQPLQFGPKRGSQACPGIYYRRLASNGTFTLSAHRLGHNCRNFTLRRGSKWLVITGGMANPSSGYGVNNYGEGSAFYAL